ncbi:MAG: glycosyltransferase family 4 protein [Candidatus Peribacteraceae bacterium]|nr:glycosyltransferase family 4 protein [Candidatus Peribacteraceae bacterium]
MELTKKKVYIQYNCLAHYRVRIIELLIKNQDYKFTVVADKDADTPFMASVDDLVDRHVNQIAAKTYQLAIPKSPIFYFQPGAITTILKDKPDVLIALGSPYSITAWLLMVLCRIIQIPVLLWGHGLLDNETGLKWLVRKVFYKMASGQLLYGEYAKELLIKKGFDEDTLHVVYNSLDFDDQLEIYNNLTDNMRQGFRNELGMKDNSRLLVFTGRLQPIKRLDMIVDAIGILKNKNLDIHVALIGEGREKQFLKELSIQNNVEDQVHFLGASFDEEYLGLVLGSSDLCVIPSGAGLSIMHSMIFGTPVLIHDDVKNNFPEWEAVIEGETGLFYKYNDIQDLVDRIKEALYPKPLKESLEENCINMIKDKYNPHKQEKIFVDAVSKHIIN